MTITILDFEQSKSNSIDYDTVQKVWGENVKISVVLKEGFKLGVDEKEKMLRSYLRVISAKLKFVEENRGAINAAILSSDIAGFSEEDLKALYINWALFVSFADTGDCELYVYPASEADAPDGREIAVTVFNDNTLRVEVVGE